MSHSVMVIFLNEERAYLSWVSHHRRGFVVDWLRKPTCKRPTLHRATCEEVRSSKRKQTHWTTGRSFKACSLDLEELVEWAVIESGDTLEVCENCRPDADAPSEDQQLQRPTKLGRDIVDYVVDTAVIHMDQRHADYRLTVADIAQYLAKTLPQISSALHQLVQYGHLRLDRDLSGNEMLSEKLRVFPTVAALKVLPAFQQVPDKMIQADLDALQREAD